MQNPFYWNAKRLYNDHITNVNIFNFLCKYIALQLQGVCYIIKTK